MRDAWQAGVLQKRAVFPVFLPILDKKTIIQPVYKNVGVCYNETLAVQADSAAGFADKDPSPREKPMKPFARPALLLALFVFSSLPPVFAQNTLPLPLRDVPNAPPVTVTEDAAKILLDNGILTLEIDRRKAEIVAAQYRHSGRVTAFGKPGNTMYFDASAGPLDVPPEKQSERPKGGYWRLGGASTTVRLARQSPDLAEVVMESQPTFWFPFQTEVHYLLPRGVSGWYAYAVYRHLAPLPAATLGEARFVLRGPAGTDVFTHHVIDRERMGAFPTSPTVKTLMDATFELADGTVYTKYNNSAFLANHHVHGMAGHGIGVWMVNASNEYVNGGPIKQELTVHLDNTLLNMLEGAHFGAGVQNFRQGEAWTKMYGPFLVYVNSGATVEALYADALKRADAEIKKWPYAWAKRPEYPVERGTVTGQLHLTSGQSTAGAWVVLAAPGSDWTQQGKDYLFWTQADSTGQFTIPKVRPGQYALYAYGANQFEQFQREGVTVEAGKTTALGTLDWQPVTHGRTLWQIGTADRATEEFRDGDNPRHWANYMRYPAAFPEDVTFVIGKSREKTDWNFAHWSWYSKRPTWNIAFDMPQSAAGKATLTFGIAASNPTRGGRTQVQVRVNGKEVGVLRLPKSGAAPYRSGGQDSQYRVEYITFDASLLKAGKNEITLGHADAAPFPSVEEQKQGRVGVVMYDAIRLEVSDK